MPSVFQHNSLCFEYPDNWTIEDSCGDELPQVVVSSPHTAFWHLSSYPRGTDLEPLFDEALAALRSEYPEMETEPALGEALACEGQQLEGFDVNFYCLDLTNTCWLRGFQTDEATYLLLCQAEDREFNRVSPVFQAMLASLLRNLA